MNAGKAVYGILSANSGVTDIVGTRIFPEIAEQEAVTPFVIYQLQSVAPEDTHDGPSKLDEVRFEFLCYADSYNEAADLGVAVRAALDRVSGTYNGVHVESVQFNDVDVEIEYDPRRYSQVLKFTFRIKRDDIEIALGTPVTGAELGDLSDVDVSGVTNGQLIAYNSTTGNWEAADDAGGAEQLNDLTDVNLGLLEDREVLMYDGQEWVNDTVHKSDIGLGNVDNTSDDDKPVSTATQTALNAKADTSAVPSALNDLSDVTIAGTPTANEALIYDGTSGVFKSLPSFTNRFVDEAENNKQAITPFAERVYTVKSDGDGIFIDPDPDTPSAGKVIKRKIYHKTGFLESGAVIGDFTLIHTFADDTAYSATESTFEGFRDGDTYGTPPFTLIQTWEEVDESTLLLDTYTGSAAAYSLRLLSSTYSGDAVEVYNGTSYADIGFADGELDTTALATHCGSNDGLVSKWYDQSGNTNTAAQTTTALMPKIYDGTTGVVTENGKPAVFFDRNSNNRLVMGTEIAVQSAFIASDATSSGAVGALIGNSTKTYSFGPYSIGGYRFRTNSNYDQGSLTNYGHFLSSFTINSSLALNVYQNGTIATESPQTVNDTLDTSQLMHRTGQYGVTGHLYEVILYTSDQSSNRTNIEDNINTFYDIYS